MSKHYQYLIVGGGMTAGAAVSGIRQVDPQGSIGLISAEPHPPYNRPPLSKALWKGKPLENIWRKTQEEMVDLHLGRKVVSINGHDKRLSDDQGEQYTYDRLLLATGGTPRKLPFGGDKILYFRTLDDYQRLRSATGQGLRFAVIGGGFIGSEIAAALAMNQQNVVMLFPEESIGARIYPSGLARYLNDYYRDKGVEARAGEMINGLEPRGERLALKTGSGQEIVVDMVVAGIGIRPNLDLAEAAGLEVGDGIIVDEYLRTSQPDIFAAGDVVSFYNSSLDERMRVEHEDNANTMGLTAGKNMAGEEVAYHHLPFFYSDLFDLGYEAVGELNPQLELVEDWQERYQKGVVYYLREGRVRGVLLWNVWGQVDAARQLIGNPGRFKAADLIGRLPEKK
jgi:3-phenylpropionate/trans-cinnamate dioxygenase ferredoxin reductase subunit